MGALKKAASAPNKGKTLKAKGKKKAATRVLSPLILVARSKRASLERARNQAILAKFNAGVPVGTLGKNYKLTSSAIYQRLFRARQEMFRAQQAPAASSAEVSVVTPQLVAAPRDETLEMSEMTQVAFLRGRIQQLEAMLKQMLTILGARKLTAG